MIINFFGDIALHNIDYKNFRLSAELKKLLAEGDLNVGNFECPITESSSKIINHPVHLKCSAESLKIVEGFHAFSLANNHLLDYGAGGVRDTLKHLQERKFDSFGGGGDQAEASMPLVKTVGGIKVALIGATRFAYANKNTPGAARDSRRRIKKTVKKLKRENCFVVIYFHWGYEYVPYPAPRERRMAHKCIDFGADLIVGSHPHIMQGFELYKHKYIFYSLGNFIFDPQVFDGLSYRENDPRLFRAFALRLHLNANREYTFQILPYQTSGHGVELLNEIEKEKLLKELDTISIIFNESYFTYLKKYFRYAAEISSQNRKIRHDYTLKDKRDLWSVIRTYARANYQDVLNRIVGALWREKKQ
jgi:hypothetical protein